MLAPGMESSAASSPAARRAHAHMFRASRGKNSAGIRGVAYTDDLRNTLDTSWEDNLTGGHVHNYESRA